MNRSDFKDIHDLLVANDCERLAEALMNAMLRGDLAVSDYPNPFEESPE